MDFSIQQGLGRYQQVDYHAILGVPLDAGPQDIRRRYMRVARTLHPDTTGHLSEADRQIAAQILSRLVNPAYEKLFNDKVRAEHNLILKMIGQRVAQDTLPFETEAANLLLRQADAETYYRETLEQLHQRQFAVPRQTMQVINEISELNLAMLRWQYAGNTVAFVNRPAPAPAPSTPPAAHTPAPAPQTTTPEPAKPSFLDQFYNRAEELVRMKDYPGALRELDDALKLDSGDARCLSLKGYVYLQTNQLKMAKIHFERALKRDKNNARAGQGLEVVEKMLAKQTKENEAKASPEKKKGKGLFGFFGK
ncbi:heat shock protein DnaJ domain-containing protein [Gloeomargarita lithophora Alchichica-D10]|uniref:Heat shock protein DnaJ domain-containing protein n=1 Tax=Gloeomargarita lithophora Alchichica-D10 TaxID=1188229 RepID=A0A1J0A9W6_9CYAN|nr:J domain-containing protein [Gloeomargarita lithophora]APB32723.1 heat shock protein DnaJ domain-containing protein [Gloeomargarita lithophora Alchichica-D10]